MKNNIGAPDIGSMLSAAFSPARVTEHPGVPAGPHATRPHLVVPGGAQACPCAINRPCPFHSVDAISGKPTLGTAGLRVVDMNAQPPTKTDRLSALVSTFLDGMLDEIADRVSDRVMEKLALHEETKALAATLAAYQQEMAWDTRHVATCALDGHLFGGHLFPECERCGCPNEAYETASEIANEEAAPEDDGPVA
jgi:hypothetical protein